MTNPSQAFDQLVRDALSRSPHLSQKNLRLETAPGRVVLKGQVGSYYQKQMAQEALRHVAGVEVIDNHLEVSW